MKNDENFLTIKKLELDFIKLYNHGKKQSTLNHLFKSGKEKGAYGMSAL